MKVYSVVLFVLYQVRFSRTPTMNNVKLLADSG